MGNIYNKTIALKPSLVRYDRPTVPKPLAPAASIILILLSLKTAYGEGSEKISIGENSAVNLSAEKDKALTCTGRQCARGFSLPPSPHAVFDDNII